THLRSLPTRRSSDLPRDILRCAMIHNAHAFILAHNHPSGDPSPSEADRQLTRRIRDAAELMKIQFADHIIIGAPRPGAKPYFSRSEEHTSELQSRFD